MTTRLSASKSRAARDTWEARAEQHHEAKGIELDCANAPSAQEEPSRRYAYLGPIWAQRLPYVSTRVLVADRQHPRFTLTRSRQPDSADLGVKSHVLLYSRGDPGDLA
jgi:hypothetical protein